MRKISLLHPLCLLVLIALNLQTGFACEIMGYSTNVKVKSNYIFKSFTTKDSFLPDGWGVAYYPDQSVQIFKEPIDSNGSDLVKFLFTYNYFISKILISHRRIATSGGPEYKNTHPFRRELNKKEYAFVYNGLLTNIFFMDTLSSINAAITETDLTDKSPVNQLSLGRFTPVGINRTENVLCHILSQIESKKDAHWSKKNFKWFQHLIHKINDYCTINCLFTDGEYLFAYHDKTDYNQLNYLVLQKNMTENIFSIVETDHPEKTNEAQNISGIIVSTFPITKGKWIRFKPGQLLVIKDGKIVYNHD
jgi:predicted glutamine amidotransferase